MAYGKNITFFIFKISNFKIEKWIKRFVANFFQFNKPQNYVALNPVNKQFYGNPTFPLDILKYQLVK